MIGRVDDALDDVRVLAGAVCAQHGDGHDADAGETDSGDTRAVVGLGRDDPGHGSAVAVRIGQAVGAVQDRRAGHEVAVEVGMRTVDAGVEHGDDRRTAGT